MQSAKGRLKIIVGTERTMLGLKIMSAVSALAWICIIWVAYLVSSIGILISVIGFFAARNLSQLLAWIYLGSFLILIPSAIISALLMSAIEVFYDLVVSIMVIQGLVMMVNIGLAITLLYFLRRLQPEERQRILIDKGVEVRCKDEEEEKAANAI